MFSTVFSLCVIKPAKPPAEDVSCSVGSNFLLAAMLEQKTCSYETIVLHGPFFDYNILGTHFLNFGSSQHREYSLTIVWLHSSLIVITSTLFTTSNNFR
jgi:hypothetical protein